MDAKGEKRWKVGELARGTGLTVRALHHYDEIELVVPVERTSGGHRLYGERDVERLYRVLALRRLGLRLDEIADVLDDEEVGLLETVRRHLEHVERELDKQRQLRERLQDLLDALERSVEPSAEQFIGTLEAMAVIETNVKDVLTWQSHIADPPEGAPLPHPPRDGQRAVLLEQQGGERVMPIWIGEPEAEALTLALLGRTAGRPLSADLTARLLEVGDLVVERVVIEAVHDFTFYATIAVASKGEAHEVDARPSDALNIAVRVGAPVFVTAELIEQGGAAPAQVPFAGTEWQPPPGFGGKPAKPIGEWRSALQAD